MSTRCRYYCTFRLCRPETHQAMIQLYTRVTYDIHMSITIIIMPSQVLASYVTGNTARLYARPIRRLQSAEVKPHTEIQHNMGWRHNRTCRGVSPLGERCCASCSSFVGWVFMQVRYFRKQGPSDWSFTPCAKRAVFGNPEPGRPSVMQASVRVCRNKPYLYPC